MAHPALARRLGLPTATLLVVAAMIGTGVFTTAGITLVPSGFVIADIPGPTFTNANTSVGFRSET